VTRLRLAALLVAALACGEDEISGPGSIEVAWTGADTGKLVVPASARWCPNDSLVEITGVSGDSGVALAVLPADTTIAPGVFSVGLPIRVRSRPGARVAIRWSETPLTQGFYGLSGTVTIDSATALSGTLEATLKSVHDDREITMSGTFRSLTISPGSAQACGASGLGSPAMRLP
jgi:hypothetical protein